MRTSFEILKVNSRSAVNFGRADADEIFPFQPNKSNMIRLFSRNNLGASFARVRQYARNNLPSSRTGGKFLSRRRPRRLVRGSRNSLYRKSLFTGLCSLSQFIIRLFAFQGRRAGGIYCAIVLYQILGDHLFWQLARPAVGNTEHSQDHLRR